MPVNVNFNTRTLIGKVKTRSQLSGIYTEDGRKVLAELNVLKGCLSDDNKLSGWLVDADELVQDEDTGLWIQLLDERSIMPVPAITGKAKTKDLKKLVNEIFKDSISVDLVTMNEEARKEKMKTWYMVILGTPIILAALILGIKVING